MTETGEAQAALTREVNTDSAAAFGAADSLRVRSDSSTTVETASDEEVVTTTREYDTAKPVDPATGTPPLKREITETRRRTDAGRREQTFSQITDRRRESMGRVITARTDSTAMQVAARGRTNVATRVETSEKRGLNTAQRVSCITGALTLLAGVVWLGVKLLKRYL